MTALHAVAGTDSRLGAAERLEVLCDPHTFRAIRSRATPRRASGRSRPGDGVIAGSGCIDGRPVFCYAQDSTLLGGSLGEAHAESILRVMRLAAESRVPLIACIESAGARMHEGVAALAGYGRIFREHVRMSGEVPQISVITGHAAGGGSYAPALTDFVVMTDNATMFLTGPAIVHEVMREDVSAAELGGARVHARNGVCQFVAPNDVEALECAREIVGYLPQSRGDIPPARPAVPQEVVDPSEHVPPDARSVYDMRRVVRAIVDSGELLEISPRWAANMICAFARIEGRSVGVIANQPKHLGGVMDADCSEKAARFVSTCDRFGVPLVVLVDTPGFLPGTRQESAGVIRHGAGLLRAFAQASVPRMTVILRKAYGGAYITMNSRDLGAHLSFAWPSAEIGVMGARQAVKIINRRELAAAEDVEALHNRLAESYAAEHLRVDVAAADGFVDEVIEPTATRDRLATALHALSRRSRRRSDQAKPEWSHIS
jgi:acetyl-CoA carboxylase carboxyltransferase component